MDNYANFEFAGIRGKLQGSFALGLGTAPSESAFSFVVDPSQPLRLPRFANLSVTYNRTQIVFHNAGIVDVQSHNASDIRVTVADRRWQWRYAPVVHGHYNEPIEENKVRWEKTPQELAKILLEALGEEDADFSQLPNSTRPKVVWDAARPDDELSVLCASLGCSVSLGLDNKIRIVRDNQGALLPNIPGTLSVANSISSVLPKKAVLYTAPVRYQMKFSLEAHATLETGETKPFEKLPEDWRKAYPPDFYGIEGTYKQDGKDVPLRELAKQTLYRLYRILNFAGGKRPEEPPFDIEAGFQILPLRSNLNEREEVNGKKQPKRARVSGVFWGNNDTDGNSEPETIYTRSFSIDANNAFVLFSEPTYKLSDDTEPEPAELYLTCVFEAKDPDNHIAQRLSWEQHVSENGTGEVTEVRDDIIPEVTYIYDGSAVSKTETNEEDVKKRLKDATESFIAQFNDERGDKAAYAGIHALQPDGAIRSVAWDIGPGGATTVASRNSELLRDVPGSDLTKQWARRRRMEIEADRERRKQEARSAKEPIQ